MIQKPLMVFLILLSSCLTITSACGPYRPNGEDVRFNMLRPELFKCDGFNAFNFSGDVYYGNKLPEEMLQDEADSLDGNVLLWQKRCKQVATYEDIYYVIYENLDLLESPYSKNNFAVYLRKYDTAALNYLIFAGDCEALNGFSDDPWERQSGATSHYAKEQIIKAMQLAQNCTDKDLKRRYAFLGLRMAYYNEDNEHVHQLFNVYFKEHRKYDIIDYWAMHFYAKKSTDDRESNFYAALVFKHAPEKRRAVVGTFNWNYPINEVLVLAKNNDEREAVYMLYGLRNPGYALNSLNKMYQYDADSKGLTFLLLREINKLEFWIYTPYLFYYKPSFNLNNFNWNDTVPDKGLRNLQNDRKYALQLLDFVSAVDLNKVDDKKAWQFSKAYLLYMTGDFAESKNVIENVQNQLPDTSQLFMQFERLNIYVAVELQTGGKPVLTPAMQPFIASQIELQDNKYIFGLARLLEIKGNTTEAAILMSHINKSDRWGAGNAYWKGKHQLKNARGYYETYIYYLDAEYSRQAMKNLVYAINNRKDRSDYGNWFYSNAEKDLIEYYNILGMKYLRIGDLSSSYYYYNQMTGMESLRDFSYVDFNITDSPFYCNLGDNKQPLTLDAKPYTKATLLLDLMYYVKRANNIYDKDRDYYAFLVANCYYNMSAYGKNGDMRRMFKGDRYLKGVNLEDLDEYYLCKTAIKYYLLAHEVSESKKFSGLALRMAGRCEENKLQYEAGEYLSWQDRASLVPKNIYYTKLKSRFPEDYKDLMSNCEMYDTFFASR